VRKQLAIQRFGWQVLSVFILMAGLLASTLAAEKLTPENVSGLVPQLFRLHLSQHDMSPAFTKRMLKEYITQLDPYNRFYLKHLEIDQEYRKAKERKNQEQPLRLVEKFYQNLYRRGDLSGMVILDKEIEFAKTLLETYSPEDITDLILYTIDAAGRTKFSIRSFGGVKVYLNTWLDEKATRAKRAAQEQKKAVQQKEQRRRDQYESWWRQQVTKLREAASPEEITAMEEAATAELMEEHQNPIGFPLMVRLRTDMRLAERYKIQSFEDWKTQGH